MPTGSCDPFGAQLAGSHEFGGAAGLSLFFSELDASAWISVESLTLVEGFWAKLELFFASSESAGRSLSTISRDAGLCRMAPRFLEVPLQSPTPRCSSLKACSALGSRDTDEGTVACKLVPGPVSGSAAPVGRSA